MCLCLCWFNRLDLKDQGFHAKFEEPDLCLPPLWENDWEKRCDTAHIPISLKLRVDVTRSQNAEPHNGDNLSKQILFKTSFVQAKKVYCVRIEHH